MSNDDHLTARQLWGQVSTHTPTTTEQRVWCTPLILPSGGVFIFADNTTSTLDARVTFKLPCQNPDPIISPDTTGSNSTIGFSGPFYASISPQVFALATATVISYILVILIFITPRTFYVGGAAGGGGRRVGFFSRRGIISSSYASSSLVGVGRRPLLQKLATVTVAVSLTIATADTFNVAEDQYNEGYISSRLLVQDVVNSLEIRIIRVISDTFLWLAQVQTLIRLFPRHKEKVTIKWLGFALVSLDTIFSILDSIVAQRNRTDASNNTTTNRTGARSFQDAIPALNYLFELAISLIYASCVLYYSLSKRGFAFYHPKMRNVCLVALVSLVAVLIPVVFFVLDIAKPNVAGWGEYIRWVGAAAASVVVWEWVERIEALEREEGKDGILGREVFDGDEMLDMTPSEEADWNGRGKGGDDDNEKSSGFGGIAARYRKARSRIPFGKMRKSTTIGDVPVGGSAATKTTQAARSAGNQITVPQSAITPPSRSDTNSAASTVYAVRYHNLTSPSPAILEVPQETEPSAPVEDGPKDLDDSTESTPSADKESVPQGPDESVTTQALQATRQMWQAVPNPFKRRRAEPPAEVAGAQIASGMRRSPVDRTLNLRDRFGAFATSQKDRFASRGSVSAAALPVTLIPAPRMNERTWSPADARKNSVATVQSSTTRRDRTENPPVVNQNQNQNQNQSQSQNQPVDLADVVVIPAPTQGRTWSPADVNETTQPRSPPPPASQKSATPTPAQHLLVPESNSVLTPRGSLTISEDGPRVRHSPQSQSQLKSPSPRNPSNTNTTNAESRTVVHSPKTSPLREEVPANTDRVEGSTTNSTPGDSRNTGGT